MPDDKLEAKRNKVDEICLVYFAIVFEKQLHLFGSSDEDAIIKSALDFAERYMRARDEKFR